MKYHYEHIGTVFFPLVGNLGMTKGLEMDIAALTHLVNVR